MRLSNDPKSTRQTAVVAVSQVRWRLENGRKSVIARSLAAPACASAAAVWQGANVPLRIDHISQLLTILRVAAMVEQILRVERSYCISGLCFASFDFNFVDVVVVAEVIVIVMRALGAEVT